MPLFPELRPYLDACYFAEGNTSEFVIGRSRGPSVNLRTQLERIITRAGLKAWTERAAIHPAHVAAEWKGHSGDVAHEHYWLVADADYERAMAHMGCTDSARLCPTAPARFPRNVEQSRLQSDRVILCKLPEGNRLRNNTLFVECGKSLRRNELPIPRPSRSIRAEDFYEIRSRQADGTGR